MMEEQHLSSPPSYLDFRPSSSPSPGRITPLIWLLAQRLSLGQLLLLRSKCSVFLFGALGASSVRPCALACWLRAQGPAGRNACRSAIWGRQASPSAIQWASRSNTPPGYWNRSLAEREADSATGLGRGLLHVLSPKPPCPRASKCNAARVTVARSGHRGQCLTKLAQPNALAARSRLWQLARPSRADGIIRPMPETSLRRGRADESRNAQGDCITPRNMDQIRAGGAG